MSSGGVEWEQGAAVTRMVQALLTNDHETMALAMADYAAALGTRTTNILSGIVTTVMLELQEIRLERLTTGRAIEHKLDLLLLANDKTQLRLTAISDATLADTINGVERQHLVDLVRTIPDLTARVERLEAGSDAE
jgi:hypothetical protein